MVAYQPTKQGCDGDGMYGSAVRVCGVSGG